MSVRRLLPLRLRRSVGAWCFIDHYGPMSVDGVTGMAVPPHPHIGLQTVTWLMAGNVLHRDSLGSEQMIRPGQLNLMTAGRGIAHAEESPLEHDPELHGVQLWVALPDASRLAEPAFEHHAELPVASTSGLAITVAGTDLAPGSMLYLPPGRERISLTAAAGTTLMLLGGVPLGERLLMWWNFVARTPQEIAAAVAGWQQGMFGEVGGYSGDPLPAPPLDISRLSRR
jgi:redox-sensitive bicupin YhaK (pirin superfamily)